MSTVALKQRLLGAGMKGLSSCFWLEQSLRCYNFGAPIHNQAEARTLLEITPFLVSSLSGFYFLTSLIEAASFV